MQIPRTCTIGQGAHQSALFLTECGHETQQSCAPFAVKKLGQQTHNCNPVRKLNQSDNNLKTPLVALVVREELRARPQNLVSLEKMKWIKFYVPGTIFLRPFPVL